MFSELYKYHGYLDKNQELLIGKEIIEFDIRSAGFNLIKRNKLLDNDTITKLEKITDKKARQKQIGLLIRRDKSKELGKKLNDSFVNIRKEFFEANDIQDDDVLSIKKDAIFLFKNCEHTVFDNVEFVKKNQYTSYMYIDKKEIYFNNDTLHVKGINDTLLKYHKDYMCDFIFSSMLLLEQSSDHLKKFLVDFSDLYKARELPIGYYREFDKSCLFRMKDLPNVLFEEYGLVDDVDINYNYMNIIIPLINILI